MDEIRSVCKGSKFLIFNNIPRPSSKDNGSTMNVEADQPAKFSLMMGDNLAMLQPNHIDEDIRK